MSIDKIIVINSLKNAINKAKQKGIFNTSKIALYDILFEYRNFAASKINYLSKVNHLDDLKRNFKYLYSDDICNTKSILPSESVFKDEEDIIIPIPIAPIVTNFTVTTSKEAILSPIDTTLYDVYNLNKEDFLNNYSDNNDGKFVQLFIDTSTLGDISIMFDGQQINQSSGNYGVLIDDIEKLSFYTNNSNNFTHNITFKCIDNQNGNFVSSNDGIITIDRTNLGESNQPATIGDAAISTNNRVTTVLSLAMFTTGLTPPYNDPEGDLIDAIRIDEISTANQGQFLYNGVAVTVNQIITREDLSSGLFTHVGPDVNTIATDAIRFSARDEGSGIWVQ